MEITQQICDKASRFESCGSLFKQIVADKVFLSIPHTEKLRTSAAISSDGEFKCNVRLCYRSDSEILMYLVQCINNIALQIR